MTNVDRRNMGFPAQTGRGLVDRVSQTVETRIKRLAGSRPFVLFVAIAVVLLGVYFFFVAAPLYVSTSSFSIRGREQAPAMGSLMSLVGGSSTSTTMETAEVREYIISHEMLEKLDQRLHLRALYSQPRLDFARHMSPDASQEEFLAFYRNLVKVRTDRDSNITTLEVASFDPKSAQQVADAILDITAGYVDSLSQTVRKDTLKASEQELQKAEAAVRDTRLAMTKYRTVTAMVDPTTTAAATAGNIISLQAQIQASRAELAGLMTYNTGASPQVKQINARIAALQGQIADAQTKITAGGRDPSLAQRLYEYEGLMVSNEYAEKQLIATMASYDAARAVAGQRERFVVKVVAPHLPDRPSRPHRLLSFLESLIVAIAAYGVIALAVAGVRDHQGI